MDYDRTFCVCRDLRHSWEPSGDVVLLENKGRIKRFMRTLSCTRCATVRWDVYEMSGYAVVPQGTRYAYPQDYRVKGGMKASTARYLLFQDHTGTGHEDNEGDSVEQ
jgi:hypothetical protein